MVQLPWKAMKLLKIIKTELPHDPTILLLVIYTEKLKKKVISALPCSLQNRSQ